ncbi:hypothetical protein, variant [Aphanomyces invadans]|nr:hypothetical protein, variant [Aphanomyces invadans]ETV95794.1 hypothetical protein, variant [Aphanomyces invadans]|eukprot:XP_008875544.1 hypothetical protein, variant [Aphanomyces invadans]
MVVSYGSIDPGTFTGMLIVHTNDTTVDPSTHGRGHGGDIWLNYTATKVSGRGLAFAPQEVEFTSCGGAGRGLVLTNYFDTAVAIEMVQLADPSLFSLHNFTGNAVAEAGTSWPPIYLDCIMDVDGNGTTTSPTLQWPVTTHTHSHLLVQTNVSRHVIPLVLSSNRLTVHTTSKRWHAMSTDARVARRHRPLDKPVAAPSATGARRAFQLDLGNISSSRHVLVNLTNFNPRAIPVHSIVAHLATLEVSLEPMIPHFAPSGMECLTRHDAGDSDDAAADDACAIDRQQTPLYPSDASSSCRSKHNMSTVIPPGYALPMVLHITPTATAATDVLAFTISTTSETIDVYLTYTPVRGSIVPTRRKLRTACPLYPGRAEVVPLYVDSTFAFPVPITAIRVSDRRVQVLSQASAVSPNGTTLVAQLVVSPAYALGCANPDKFADCLLPVPIASRDWTPPSHGMLSSFGQAVTPADVAAHFQRLQRFAELETQGDTVAEMQVVMYTDLVAVAPVVVRMPMARPRLVGESTTHAGMVEMPLTHVGNVSEMWLTVTNPSNVTIDVALALLASKDSDEIGARGGFYTCPSPTKVVAACKDTWKAAVTSGDGAVAMPAFFLSSMDKQTLAPGDTTTLGPILFAPSAAKEYVGRLYLRNTLSHIEPVVVRGQGGRGHVRVVNNAVLDSHAPPRVIALENDGNMPLVVHGWSCPNCGKCSGHDAGFCVQFPGSSTSDAVPVELAPGGSRLSLNVSFVSGCRFNREVEVVVLHTSSGNVSVPLEGAVASPYRECLGTTRMSYLHAGGRVIVWGLFALIVSQIVHYTVEIVWLDCHASPADTNFGYTPPVATEAPAFPDHVDDDALDDELQAIEAQVFESFTFAPIRSPAVQRVHDQRKAALAQKPTDKKKAKPKKALAATTRPDAVRTAHATRTCSPRDDVATVAAPVVPDESPSKNGPTASPRTERCNAEDAQLTPVSPHRAPPDTTRGAEHEQNTLSSTPSTTADGCDLQHDRGTAMKRKNALSSWRPAIATTTHVEHHPAELAHAVRASAHLPPARGASRQVPPVAQEFPQGVVHGPGSASHAACATYLVDQAKADHNEAADDAEDNGTSSVVTAACATVNDVAKICAAGNDTSTKCEERVVESDDGVRYTAGDNGSDTETGAVDGDCSAESKSSDEDGTDNGADDTDDGIHATDALKLDADDAVDDGSGSDDPTWSADLDRVPLHVDSTSRDNTIVLDEIDQLMQEVHNEQQFRWHEPSLLSPGRGNATHWHDELPPHSALRHDQFAMPRRPHTSFPPRSIKSPVAAPPGFSAADADPLAVSRTYAHLGQLRRPPHDNIPPPMWDNQAFKAPLVLFGSSYFTGHQAGRIGSRRPCRSNPPAERPSQRHDFEPFHRNAFPGRDRSLASLVDVDAPFESSRDVFLKSETSPLQRDSRFGFW